jgi:hypothetical protein
MTVVLVVVVVAVIAIALIVAVTRGRSRGLRPLPDESRDRFARSWRAIESRFIEDPPAAIREADKVAVMVLTERGATLDDTRSVPDDLSKARQAASSDKGRAGTEGMRQAMVHYKAIVDDAVGTSRKKRDEEYRRGRLMSGQKENTDDMRTNPEVMGRTGAGGGRRPQAPGAGAATGGTVGGPGEVRMANGDLEMWPDMTDFHGRFQRIQSEFIDDPKKAVMNAEKLTQEMLDHLMR